MTISDGIAVKIPGDLTFSVVNKYVEDIVLVEEEAIASTILMLGGSKIKVEGAGAISLAAVLNKKIPCEGKIVCAMKDMLSRYYNMRVNFFALKA